MGMFKDILRNGNSKLGLIPLIITLHNNLEYIDIMTYNNIEDPKLKLSFKNQSSPLYKSLL